MMPEKNLFLTFAERTWKNYNWLKSNVVHSNQDFPPFDVTQMINSLLGLLVFQREKNKNCLSNQTITLENMKVDGWPIPIRTNGHKQPATLWGLISMLRHAIAHGGIEFLPDNEKPDEIGSVVFRNKFNGQVEWEGKMTVPELERFLEKMHSLVAKASQ